MGPGDDFQPDSFGWLFLKSQLAGDEGIVAVTLTL